MFICNTTKNIELRKIGEIFDRGETIVDIGAFCLISNHFHILAKEKFNNGISKYMLKLMTAYSMYFNKKYKRTGKLYQGVFKSVHVENDNHLKYLYSYIHLNPAKIKDKDWRDNKKRNMQELSKYAWEYPYSSLKEYLNEEFKILNPKEFPSYFKDPIDHKNELFEWLNITEDK